MQELWKSFVDQLLDAGKKSVASIMLANQPILKENKIHFEVPNGIMQNQLERSKPKLLKFIRTSLNNFKVGLEIDVNEVATKKYAYTPQEKYEKLKEKNEAISLLKKTFDLEL